MIICNGIGPNLTLLAHYKLTGWAARAAGCNGIAPVAIWEVFMALIAGIAMPAAAACIHKITTDINIIYAQMLSAYTCVITESVSC